MRSQERQPTREGPEGKPLNAPASVDTSPKPLVDELAWLLRDLHQLLESYAPHWYSAQIDSRVRGMLAEVKWVLDKRG